MSSRTSGWMACAALALTLTGTTSSASAGALEARLEALEATALRSDIAFVDFERALTQFNKTAEITDEFEDKLGELRAVTRKRVNELRRKIEELEEEERLAAPGEAMTALDRSKKMLEFRKERIEIEAEESIQRVSMEQRFVQHTKDTYERVVRACQQIAAREGYTAVFMKQSGEIEGNTQEAVNANILIRPVLWSADGADITAQVIEALNR